MCIVLPLCTFCRSPHKRPISFVRKKIGFPSAAAHHTCYGGFGVALRYGADGGKDSLDEWGDSTSKALRDAGFAIVRFGPVGMLYVGQVNARKMPHGQGYLFQPGGERCARVHSDHLRSLGVRMFGLYALVVWTGAIATKGERRGGTCIAAAATSN
jgi:hypothetical protein